MAESRRRSQALGHDDGILRFSHLTRGHVDRGYYGNYLRRMSSAVGPRIWSMLRGMDPLDADCILAALGIVPWIHSLEAVAMRKRHQNDAKAPESMDEGTELEGAMADQAAGRQTRRLARTLRLLREFRRRR